MGSSLLHYLCSTNAVLIKDIFHWYQRRQANVIFHQPQYTEGKKSFSTYSLFPSHCFEQSTATVSDELLIHAVTRSLLPLVTHQQPRIPSPIHLPPLFRHLSQCADINLHQPFKSIHQSF
eukprot:scaffold10609_cov199-Ochromonas_danica.AAC.3